MEPQQLRFSTTHEWVHVSGDDPQRIATVGISAFAVEQLTDLVHMELPEVGRTVQAGESIGEIESVKAVSDLYSPVAGEVVEVNLALADQLEALNDDPYGNSWIVKLRITDDSGLDSLLDYEAYQRQCGEDAS